jgi:hypothetical protein
MRRVTTVFLLALLIGSLTLAWAGSARAASSWSSCLAKSSITSWGAGEVRVCAGDGRGRYSGYTVDKAADGSCVRWRILWDNKPDTYTPQACPQSGTTTFDQNAPVGVSGVRDAFLEQVKI